jgi:hypothetical protein
MLLHEFNEIQSGLAFYCLSLLGIVVSLRMSKQKPRRNLNRPFTQMIDYNENDSL